MARLTFMDLSTDLKTLILSYIIRPRDLVSLCLTCTQLHEIAVRQLYHTIILDLGSEADKQLPAMLNPRNIGVKHIKNIELYKADVVDPCGVERQADLAMRMLLEFLPENQLERWSFHPWSSFSSDNMMLLYKKQKKMKWLEAIALEKPFCACLFKQLNLDSVVGNVTKLGLYPDSRDTLDFAHELLRRATKVSKITLHTNFEHDELDGAVSPAELNDSPTGHGLLTRTIFAHLLPFDKCTPLNLVDLTMQRVHLRYAANSFCKVINFPNLQSLRISECSGGDALLAALCQSSNLPHCLKTFEFKHDDDGRDCEATTALEGFLCLVSGVERLTIDLGHTKRFPNESCVTRHARTLKLLNIHANPAKSTDGGDEDEYVCEIDAFEKICQACTALEQLSVAFPPTPITRLPSDDFTSFSIALGALPNLVTLNITSWPTNVPSSGRMPRKLYEQLLQGMAQTGFEASIANAQLNSSASHAPTAPSLSSTLSISTHPTAANASSATPTLVASSSATTTTAADTTTPAPPPPPPPPQSSKLRIIAFGSSDKIHEREDSKNIVVFVRGRQSDPLGRADTTAAIPVGWCMRKFVEPRSEVLDFGLMRSTRPPTTREIVGEDDGDW